MVLLAIQALGAIGGGVGLVQDPENNIGMSLNLLEGSPFDDYLIPGLILLIVVGLLPVVVLYGLVRRLRWGWWLALAAGAGLVVWIITEVVLLGYLPGSGLGLQIGMGLLGVIIVGLTLAGPTRRFFQVGG
jgi:Kef-type K+ transport system membrane component KefB